MKGQSLPSPAAHTLQSPQSSSLPLTDIVSDVPRPKSYLDQSTPPTDPSAPNLRESGSSYIQSVHWRRFWQKFEASRMTCSPRPRARLAPTCSMAQIVMPLEKKYWRRFLLVQSLTVLWLSILIHTLSLLMSSSIQAS